MVKCIFFNYRGGKHTQNKKQILIKIDGINDRKQAASFIGKKVIWNNPQGRSHDGKILGVHGRGGVLKASFRKGLPGQAIGANLTIS
jgi:large subunit ribosomal protein L35Ae